MRADADSATSVRLDAPSAWDAVQTLRGQLVDSDLVLYVRRLD